MHSVSYYDLSIDEHQQFYTFLREASRETSQPAHINMWDEDWENKNHTLPYILKHTNRFQNNGLYHVVFDGNSVVACGGAYTSDFCTDIAIIGVRTWIHHSYRNQLIARNYLLPVERTWAIDNNHKAIMMSFNDYNKSVMKIWNKRRIGEHRTKREDYHFGFNGTHEIPFPVRIQYTKQYGMYEKINDSWEFDWESIRWVDNE